MFHSDNARREPPRASRRNGFMPAPGRWWRSGPPTSHIQGPAPPAFCAASAHVRTRPALGRLNGIGRTGTRRARSSAPLGVISSESVPGRKSSLVMMVRLPPARRGMMAGPGGAAPPGGRRALVAEESPALSSMSELSPAPQARGINDARKVAQERDAGTSVRGWPMGRAWRPWTECRRCRRSAQPLVPVGVRPAASCLPPSAGSNCARTTPNSGA